MRFTATYSMPLEKDWTSRNALVTTRGGRFFVYLYDEEGIYETFIDEADFADIESALDFAHAFGGDPRSLEVTDEQYTTLLRWSA